MSDPIIAAIQARDLAARERYERWDVVVTDFARSPGYVAPTVHVAPDLSDVPADVPLHEREMIRRWRSSAKPGTLAGYASDYMPWEGSAIATAMYHADYAVRCDAAARANRYIAEREAKAASTDPTERAIQRRDAANRAAYERWNR